MGIHNINCVAIYLLINCVIILSKKVPDINTVSSEKPNDCKRCKVLSDSFEHWLQKTSRGKYEGGDAAWEEAKLKSYARSEIRLVEIQEGLCSEVKRYQDHCYALAEEAEQLLEKWWLQENPGSVDMYSWLCIDSLKNCCPKNHYGENCEACKMGFNNQVCGGRGRCDGEGTRQGTGACQCRRGFSGTSCEECAPNYFPSTPDVCEACHASCDNCSGSGADRCTSCKSGWTMEGEACVDVNECVEPTACATNHYCVNEEGSHICKECDTSCKSCKGAGPSKCLSCEDKHELWRGVCVGEEMREELIINAIRRAALYLGLLIITMIVFRTSSALASITIIVIAIYVYFSEKSKEITTLDVVFNAYFK